MTYKPSNEQSGGRSEYRGYEIQLRREWSNWCARIYPMRPELPILTQSPLLTLSLSPEEALAAGKRSIDAALGDLAQDVA